MKYYEAPYYCGEPGRSLFIAGGITGCPDFQAVMVRELKDTSLMLFNPRRAEFDVKNPNASYEQIRWEHYHLKRADAISFWFCKETVQPIVLFELGKWFQHKLCFIGVDPEYSRRQDVEIQVRLDRNLRIAYSLEGLLQQIKNWNAE